MLNINNIYQGDCLKLMGEIPTNSIDMVLCDPPYNITQCSWDNLIPFHQHYFFRNKYIEGFRNVNEMQEHELDNFYAYLKKKRIIRNGEPFNSIRDELIQCFSPFGLWEHYDRICKPNASIVLTSAQPFTTKLISSNFPSYKYSYVWVKNKKTGFLNAKIQPLRQYEDIVVFYKNKCTYNPQKTKGHKPVNSFTKHGGDGETVGKTKLGFKGGGQTDRYPSNVLYFDVVNNDNSGGDKLYPTQKPEKLFKWLIETYSNVGDVILDNCSGSGTTAIAAIKCKRNYICIDKEEEAVSISRNRVDGHLNN